METNEPNKYLDTLKKYETELNDAQVTAEVNQIIADGYDANNTKEVLNTCLGCIDLTTLHDRMHPHIARRLWDSLTRLLSPLL